MGCPTQVELGDTCTFSITTHDPDTGVLTDATGSPAYRIYEDETDPPILTGSLAKLDDDDTTGFYTEIITCSTANGFEVGKTYTIYITATVDGDEGGIAYAFNVTNTRTYATSSAAWGSINSGLAFRGTVTAAVAGVSFTIAGLAGQGAGAFVDSATPWYAYVFRDAGGLGGAPQGEAKAVTAYTSATGLFTTEAFSAAVAVGDDVIIMSGRIAAIPEIKAVTDALTEATAAKLALSGSTIVLGTVSEDNTAASTTVFYSDDITEATADHYNGRIIIFTSGNVQNQATDIVDYALVSGEGQFTVTALTEAPDDNATFVIV